MTSNPSASAAAEVQTLLRFLSQDARLPLSMALSKINELRKAKLNTAEALSKTSTADLCPIFSGDEKVAKQVLTAARRVSNPKSKKRSGPGEDGAASKRARGPGDTVRSGRGGEQSPAELEASLVLPSSTLSIEELQSVTLQSNRAPLLLAFAVTLLKYTMPEQPLSSRLSLAQAVVSANSRTKAQSIGLVGGKSADEEGWADGQPRVKIMGRMVPVMRRSAYHPDNNTPTSGDAGPQGDGADPVREADQKTNHAQNTTDPPLPVWGLDLEALRKINTAKPTPASGGGGGHLPIHTPQSARSYLLKSFTQTQPSKPDTTEGKPDTAAALSHLLKSLDLLFSSWAATAAREGDDLDGRAWSWYVRVRPDVAGGERGWGQKGMVSLRGILALRLGGEG